MNSCTYPLLFAPLYQDYVWGGSRIRDTYRRQGTPARCAESWEIADRPEGCSVVTNGPAAGFTLNALLQAHPEALMGAGFAGSRFPLLVKVLDAHDVLSVQVHPDDDSAARFGGEAKTEMWHLLAADPGASVYAGLIPGVTPERLRAALSEGRVAPLLQRLPMHTGDTIFIPGGQIHAVASGCLILEIQQNSNTTYRLYDWDRTDAQGKSRALHIEEAMRVARCDVEAPPLATPTPLPAPAGAQAQRLVHCAYFDTDLWTVTAPIGVTGSRDRCRLLFLKSGHLGVSAGGVEAALTPGTSCLLPAACVAGARLTPLGGPACFVSVTPG